MRTTPEQVPEEAGGHEIPWGWSPRSCDPPDKSPVSQTPVLWKSSKSASHASSHVTVGFAFAFFSFLFADFCHKG